MKFQILCTSGEIPNFPGVEEHDFGYTETQPVDDPRKLATLIPTIEGDPSKKLIDHLEKLWYSDGQNHRIENNQIARDKTEKGYAIELNTLDELLALTYGETDKIIIYPDKSWYCIEIYDSYRE